MQRGSTSKPLKKISYEENRLIDVAINTTPQSICTVYIEYHSVFPLVRIGEKAYILCLLCAHHIENAR
jgi:hypothetical protein